MKSNKLHHAGLRQIVTGNNAGQLFLYSAVVILILLPLFQKGTFIDGMLYKAVAYNYYAAQATFWQMKFTSTSMPVFCEQPPLYFYLLGNWYKFTGTSYIADRFFTFLLFVTLLVLLYNISRIFFGKRNFYFFLMVFFLVSISVFCWSYVNQVIEPLVCVWSALGLWSFARALRSPSPVYLILFVLALLLSFLSKGFQSCFILGLPLFYWLLNSRPRLFRFFVSAGAALLLILAVVLKWYAPAAEWFSCYYHSRLILTMQDIGGTTDYHLEIIVRYFTELFVPLIMITGLLVYLKTKMKYPLHFVFRNFYTNKLAMALLFTSFLGAFPFALSLVQRGFYLLPAFVFFVCAIALGLKRYWLILYKGLMHLQEFKLTRFVMPLLALLTTVVFVIDAGSYKRDETLLKDLAVMRPYLEKKETVLISEQLWNYFSLHAYLYMDAEVSLSTRDEGQEKMIIDRGADTSLAKGYSKVPGTQQLDLYIRK